MTSSRAWIAVIAVVCFGLAAAWLAPAVGKPPANPPIVLHYRENPVFLGPHEHSVSAVAFSPDGRLVATGEDGCLRLWDCATGRLKSIHSDDATRGIQALAFSPDGQMVATTGTFLGKDAVLWEVATGRLARDVAEAASPSASSEFIYKGKPIAFRAHSAVAFSPDGRTMATSGDGVILRDAQSGDIVASLNEPAKGVTAIAFSADGKTLATASDDKKVRLWTLPAGRLEATLEGASQPLSGIAISPDGTQVVAVGSGNRSILSRAQAGHLWAWERAGGIPRQADLGDVQVRAVVFVTPTAVAVATGREVLSLDLSGETLPKPSKLWSHSQDVLSLAVSPDRRLLATGSADRTADLVDLATGKLVHRLPGLNDIISDVATSSDGKHFATATLDLRFSTRLPDNDGPFAKRYGRYFAGEANSGRIHPGEVRIGTTDDGRMQMVLPLPSCQVTAIDFVPNSDQLVVAGWTPDKGGMLSLWDAKRAKHVRDFDVGKAEILTTSVSSDGRTLASGDADGNVELWDLESAAKKRSHKHDGPVEAVTFSADGKHLATGDARRTVRIFDESGTKTLQTRSRSYIESLDFSPDGRQLAAGTRDPGLEIWDLQAGKASRTLTATGDHFDRMPGFVAFSKDGRFVVCGGRGKDIAVFDAATGALHSQLKGHYHVATVAVFLPDGRLISGAEERTVRLWDLNSSKGLAIWIVMPARAQQGWSDQWIGFTPGGPYVGSSNLERLVGWQSGGEYIPAAEDADRRRVETLFPSGSAKALAEE